MQQNVVGAQVRSVRLLGDCWQLHRRRTTLQVTVMTSRLWCLGQFWCALTTTWPTTLATAPICQPHIVLPALCMPAGGEAGPCVYYCTMLLGGINADCIDSAAIHARARSQQHDPQSIYHPHVLCCHSIKVCLVISPCKRNRVKALNVWPLCMHTMATPSSYTKVGTAKRHENASVNDEHEGFWQLEGQQATLTSVTRMQANNCKSQAGGDEKSAR